MNCDWTSDSWIVGEYSNHYTNGLVLKIYIYCLPQTDCFVVSQLFSVARQARFLKLGYYVEVLRKFRKRFLGKRQGLLKLGQWHFHQDNASVHNSILVIDYLTKMGIKTVPQPPYGRDLAPCDFWLFPNLRGCRYETIEEMKEAVMKVIDTLTQEDFHGALQKLLEWYNKCIAARGDYLEGE